MVIRFPDQVCRDTKVSQIGYSVSDIFWTYSCMTMSIEAVPMRKGIYDSVFICRNGLGSSVFLDLLVQLFS